jgi:type VI secretion system protein VasG
MSVNQKALIGKLNRETRSAMDAAVGLCVSRTHYDIEIEHFLMKLLDASDGDFAFILKHYGIDKARLAAELTRSLDKLKSGNARNPALSPSLIKMLTEAWTLGSVNYGAEKIRTGHAVLALIANEELARMTRDISKELLKIGADALKAELPTITAESVEVR